MGWSATADRVREVLQRVGVGAVVVVDVGKPRTVLAVVRIKCPRGAAGDQRHRRGLRYAYRRAATFAENSNHPAFTEDFYAESDESGRFRR